MAGGLETGVQLALNVFPNRVAVRTYDHAALGGTVVRKARFDDYVGIPLRKIRVYIGYFFDEFLFHIISVSVENGNAG